MGVDHDRALHVKGVAANTEQHFQSLTAELLAAAKEADRDVWEQRNSQFNNLLICATLMFGIAMSTIIEGSYDDQESTDLLNLLFVTSVGFSLVSLFVCLVACLLVMRRMSRYMIQRSKAFVKTLAKTINLAQERVHPTASHPILRTHPASPLPTHMRASGSPPCRN